MPSSRTLQHAFGRGRASGQEGHDAVIGHDEVGHPCPRSAQAAHIWHAACQNNALIRPVAVVKHALMGHPYPMERLISAELDSWLASRGRRTLVIRGARQVGKTWLVRDLAKRNSLDLVEANFERSPHLADIFTDASPHEVFRELSLLTGRELRPETSLLFIDEIQVAPAVLSKLRWFTEDFPELPVVAAGSLLEFALGEKGFSMPVGRVTYRFVEPLSFEEYLSAHDQEQLLSRIRDWKPGEELGALVHKKAATYYERYSMVGGMPAAVSADVEFDEPQMCRRIQTDLMATYRDDFAKYVGRMDPRLLDIVLVSVAAQLGDKFVYSRAGEDVKYKQAKQSLELLALSRLVTLAPHSTAEGIPLGGAIDIGKRKAIFLDVGLAHAILRTPAVGAFPKLADLGPNIRGKLTEQLAGQQLRNPSPSLGDEPILHYWQRSGGRPGEIDFLIEIDQVIVPVELKAGASGSMKSLHQFMHDKQLELAVRIDTNPPSVMDAEVRTTQGDQATYRLLSLPGYMLWRVTQLVRGMKA
ncbi:MAG: putative AAA+ superfamily ATPase [Planctomycetota bacterium]